MWNPDVVLPVVVGILTSALAYMGVHVTLYPPQGKARIMWPLGFAAVAIVGCALIAWQGIRSVRAQGDLQSQLNKIQHNTEQPPTVNVPAPVINIPALNSPKPTAQIELDRLVSAYNDRTWLKVGQELMANIFSTMLGQHRQVTLSIVPVFIWFPAIQTCLMIQRGWKN